MNCTIRLLGDVNLSSPTATVSPPPPLPTTRCQHCHRISSSSCNRRRVYPRERIPHVVPSFGEQRPEEEDPPLPPQAPMFAASDCAICLGQFAVGDEIRELPPCRHAYHVACIDIWLRSHSFCPYCCQILVVDGRFPANKREYRMINVFLP